jgi:hypothetical protein
MTIEFKAWPKIARLNREIYVTEKIDGTNAAIIVTETGEVGAQSRSRVITPEEDNFGFAAWVQKNADQLREVLGEGYHFGEWWGGGIQRKYGLEKTAKRFSLFNVKRWQDVFEDEDNEAVVDLINEGLDVVPVLYSGPYNQKFIDYCLEGLRANGSAAMPGFMDPEGIVVYHVAANQMFKVTLKGDDEPKSVQR